MFKRLFLTMFLLILCRGLIYCSGKVKPPSSSDWETNWLRKNSKNENVLKARGLITIDENHPVDQLNPDFTDPIFIAEKINESEIIKSTMSLKRNTKSSEESLTSFNLYENDMLKYTVKTELFKNLQVHFKHEDLLCYEIAKKIKTDDILPFTRKIIDGIILYSYISYDERYDYTKLAKSLWQLEIFGSGSYIFIQIDVEKALVFSFLTMQQHMNDGNVLLKQTNDKNVLQLYLTTFDYSMSEKNKNESSNGLATMPCFLTPKYKEHLFKKNLKKSPSNEIKELVNTISENDFEDLFDEYKLPPDDRNSFYKRLKDLKNAFEDYPKESLDNIFIHLFKSCDIFLKPQEVFEIKLDIPREENPKKKLTNRKTPEWNYKKILGGTVLMGFLGWYLYSLFKKRKTN